MSIWWPAKWLVIGVNTKDECIFKIPIPYANISSYGSLVSALNSCLAAFAMTVWVVGLRLSPRRLAATMHESLY